MVITDVDDGLDGRFDFVAADQNAAQIEGVFNKFGWIPVIGTMSGALRLTIGKIMIIVGLVMTVYQCMAACISNDPNGHQKAKEYAGYAAHGFMNMCRASIEMIPFVNTIVLVSYDLLIGRFSYSHENQRLERPSLNPFQRS